jgi:hypothetical protein
MQPAALQRGQLLREAAAAAEEGGAGLRGGGGGTWEEDEEEEEREGMVGGVVKATWITVGLCTLNQVDP